MGRIAALLGFFILAVYAVQAGSALKANMLEVTPSSVLQPGSTVNIHAIISWGNNEFPQQDKIEFYSQLERSSAHWEYAIGLNDKYPPVRAQGGQYLRMGGYELSYPASDYDVTVEVTLDGIVPTSQPSGEFTFLRVRQLDSDDEVVGTEILKEANVFNPAEPTPMKPTPPPVTTTPGAIISVLFHVETIYGQKVPNAIIKITSQKSSDVLITDGNGRATIKLIPDLEYAYTCEYTGAGVGKFMIASGTFHTATDQFITITLEENTQIPTITPSPTPTGTIPTITTTPTTDERGRLEQLERENQALEEQNRRLQEENSFLMQIIKMFQKIFGLILPFQNPSPENSNPVTTPPTTIPSTTGIPSPIQTTATTNPTPTTTATATPPLTVPPTPFYIPEPGPTVTVPPALDVRVDVQKNPLSVTPEITVTFQGGKGQLLTDYVDVRVTRSGGQVKTARIDRPGPGMTIPAGSSIIFEGTRGTDRVEVSVTINGVTYKIIDKVFPS
jgi:hypothetical protein